MLCIPARPRALVLGAGLAVAALGTALPAIGTVAPAAADSAYTVRPGDTIWDIARRTGVSAEALAGANGLKNPNLLVAGTPLRVPPSARGVRSPAPAGRARGTVTHTVRAGDTWWGLARRYGVRADQLALTNGASLDQWIYPGQRLVIAGTAGAARSAPSRVARDLRVTVRYTVKAGDTLDRIARRYGTTPGALADGNDRPVGGVLRVGSELSVPRPVALQGGPGRLPAKIRTDRSRLALLATFDTAAAEFGVPPDLLKSVGYMESGWQPQVLSDKGAMGIGQLMPETAREVAQWMHEPQLDAWKATDNIRMSARYLRFLLDINGGDARAALAAYYQGQVSVKAHGLYVDTQNYVRVIQANRAMFR